MTFLWHTHTHKFNNDFFHTWKNMDYTHTRTHARTHTHTQLVKSLGSVRLYIFFKDVSSAHQAVSIWSKIQKICYFVKYYCNLVKKIVCTLKYNLVLWSKLTFQHHSAFIHLQCHMIFRNNNNMLIYNQCWKPLCCFIFFGTRDIFILGFSD